MAAAVMNKRQGDNKKEKNKSPAQRKPLKRGGQQNPEDEEGTVIGNWRYDSDS